MNKKTWMKNFTESIKNIDTEKNLNEGKIRDFLKNKVGPKVLKTLTDAEDAQMASRYTELEKRLDAFPKKFKASQGLMGLDGNKFTFENGVHIGLKKGKIVIWDKDGKAIGWFTKNKGIIELYQSGWMKNMFGSTISVPKGIKEFKSNKDIQKEYVVVSHDKGIYYLAEEAYKLVKKVMDKFLI